MLLMGSAYALMVNANTNGVGHNFIHNPFFRAPLLNRLFGVTQSIACCFSQTYYDAVHMSITRATPTARTRTGKRSTGCRSIGTGTGEPENPWRYVFLSFFRDNPAAIARELKKRRQIRAVLGQH